MNRNHWLFKLIIFLFLRLTDAKKTICVKRQYSFQSTSFYQRIEIQSSVDCVERCIENSDACKAAIYIEYSSKNHKTFCQFYNVNSDTRKSDIRPTKHLDPMHTVFELLDSCPSEVASHSRRFVQELSPSIKRLLDALPPSTKNRNNAYQKVQNELTLLVNDQKSPDKSLIFGRNGQFAERDDVGNRQTYLVKPKYPFDGQKQPIRPTISRASVETNAFDPNDINANGGDGGAPEPLRRPVALVNSQPASIMTNSLPGNPIQPVLVSHGGIPQGNSGGNTYITSGVRPSGYSSYNAGYNTGSANRLGQSFNCPPNPCGIPQPIPCPRPPIDPCQTPISMSVDKQPAYWSEWAPSSPCSVTCGSGVRQRKRFCSSGKKSDCPGQATKEEPCFLPDCNVWGDWTSWSKCSASCSGGQQTRVRACRNGKDCDGPAEETRECAENQCPKPAAMWGPWERWTDCSKSCGGGERIRRRECLNGLGDDCIGAHLDQMFCNTQPCPNWESWREWSQCSATCGDGASRLRTRECKYQGFPSHDCPGTAQDQAPCQLKPCPSWGSWSDWGSCSASCGHGQEKRTRECEPKGSVGCTGGNQEIRFCQLAVCPYYGSWTEWTPCSASCGRGTTKRTRKCVKNESLPGAVLPTEEELTSGNIESFRPEPEQEEDSEGPVVEEVENTENTEENENEEADGGEARSKTKSGPSNKKPENKNSAKAQLIERSQALKNSTSKGRSVRKPHLREQTLEVAQSSSMQLADRRRAPTHSSLLALRDSPSLPGSSSSNDGCSGPDSEMRDCQIGPCCDWSEWGQYTYCADPCNSNGGQKVRSRTCQIQVTYAIPAPTPLMSFVQPHHDYIPTGVEFGVRVKRQYRPYTYNSYATGASFGRANPVPQPGQPFGMPVATNQPVLLPGSPFGTQQATCECPGKAMELEKCSGGPSGCSQGGSSSAGTSSKGQKKGGQSEDGGEASALSEANDGESRSGKGRNSYGKQRSGGIGSSVELTDAEVEASNDQKCEWGNWGSWNTCRGTCKNGNRSRTRACKRRTPDSSETYSTFRKFIRAVDEQCQCDGDGVETEKCKPKNCNDKNVHDTPPANDKGLLNDEANCYFSEWSEWSTCSKDHLKRRTRLCVGLRALLENCKCDGPTLEEKSCKADSSKPSSAVLAISRDILRDRLDKTDSKLEDKHLASRQFDSPTVNKEESNEKILRPSKTCKFLEWSSFSDCEGLCGESGKRKRTRLCPCSNCGNGTTEEIETCQTDPCLPTTNNKKYPFDD